MNREEREEHIIQLSKEGKTVIREIAEDGPIRRTSR